MRKSGILMHITSMPGPYGIGTMGKNAFAFLDFLKKSGQSSWQMLPLTPTGYGDSPYQSCSAYAGNPYLIDLDLLVEEGLLEKEELEAIDWGTDPAHVDFGKIYNNRTPVLEKAYARFTDWKALAKFEGENEAWLPDFAMYMALKADHKFTPWFQWEEELKFRDDEAMTKAWLRLEKKIHFYCFVQYLFAKQWAALREYAKKLEIELIGDVPIYVPYDSVEVWKNPELFQLDETLTPVAVAGCPPDAFSDDGQLWGNPLYRWDVHEESGFAWWLDRLGAAGKLFDVIRLDHFRGFEAYWSVPYGDKTAKGGKWVPGPGQAFIDALKTGLPELKFIAEDLGFLTEGVLKLRDDSGYPGMKVLGFAFDSADPNDYRPHMYHANTVCYTGTHDNMTTQQWFDTASKEAVQVAVDYMALTKKEGYVWGTIRTALSSVSELAMVPMQDYLVLGADARMNFPGTTGSNWTWRAPAGFDSDKLAKKIFTLSKRYDRTPAEKKPVKEEKTETKEEAEQVKKD